MFGPNPTAVSWKFSAWFIVLMSLDSLDTVAVVVTVLVSERTIPRVFDGVPEFMVSDVVASARFFAASRVSKSAIDTDSVAVRIFAESRVTLLDIVSVSLRVLTTLVTPAFD